MAEAAFDMAAYEPRMKTHYRDVVVPQLTEEFGYGNSMMVPRMDKIVLNMGVGEAVVDTKKVQLAADDLALIAGQKPVITKARKSIATFKVREGMPIGARVTLRQMRMWEFVAGPRWYRRSPRRPIRRAVNAASMSPQARGPGRWRHRTFRS